MLVNGYEVGSEPTNEELKVYWRVHEFFRQQFIAQWLEDEEVRLTTDEFLNLCDDFEELDFSWENNESLRVLYDEIVERREEDDGGYVDAAR